MILIFKDDPAHLLGLACNRVRVVVAEPVPLVAEPDPDGHGQAEPLRLVELLVEPLDAPRPRGSPPHAGEKGDCPPPADPRPLDDIGLAVAKELGLATGLNHTD